jgi:hypothetical protein
MSQTGWVPDAAPVSAPSGGWIPDAPPTVKSPLADEFAKSYGLSGEDAGWSDIAGQTLDNLKKSVKQSYQQAQKVTGEQGKSPAGSPFSLALTAPNLIANGIEGMANLLHSGVPMVLSSDPEMRQRGYGRLLAGLSQVALGEESPEGEGIAARATQYTPKTLEQMKTGTGEAAPANIFQGAMNRSTGAQVSDVRYGDPSKALIQEGINSPTTAGRLYGATDRLGELVPQLNSVLSQATKPVDIIGSISPIIDKAMKDIANSFETDAVKAAAHQDLNALWTNALERAPSGSTDAVTANAIKQSIGDSVNWGKRPTPQMPIVENAYRQAYGSIKNGVFDAAPQSQGLMERVTNLLALKNSLTNEAQSAKAGRGGMASLSIPQRVESSLGRVAPAAISTSQEAARLARVPAVAPAAVNEDQANQ